MTAVLSPTDALRRGGIMGSLDDNQINYSTSSTDWRAKYNEVADMLAETRAELDEFQHSSKELEEELVNELERTEKAQQDLKIKIARAENERDDWKAKFMSLQTTHNTTTTSLQRELDTLRQEHQKTKVQLRELEMGNDDLERNERAVSSSLADIESKYSRALEEKILLEHELLDKAGMEEEFQRLKDEIRDANVEISILKDQITTLNAAAMAENGETLVTSAISSILPHTSASSEEDLLRTPPPAELHISDLSSSLENHRELIDTPRPRQAGQTALLQRAGFQPVKSKMSTPNSSPSSLARSRTLPSLLSQSRMPPPRTPVPRQPSPRNVSAASTSTAGSTASKNKGVQMVSEMRARVKILEQKIHTRVPRLRMGSTSSRANMTALSMSTATATGGATQQESSKSALAKFSLGEDRGLSLISRKSSSDSTRRSVDSDADRTRTPKIDTSGSGWVLIMEDSPSPTKDEERGRRRMSNPSAPTAFRPMASTSDSPTLTAAKSVQGIGNMGIRRPQSRLSGGSLSTSATTSSIPTPTSRPATPTFLPLPSASLYAHPSTAGVKGLKRSTAPGPAPQKRSSLGSSSALLEQESHRPVAIPPATRPSPVPPSNTLSKYDRLNEVPKALPELPSIHSNITLRPSTRLPSSNTSTSLFSQSRIGRPSGRKSDGADFPS